MMKKLKYLFCLSLALFLAACANDDDNSDPIDLLSRRTIMVYTCGDNNISGSLEKDLEEMKEGSKLLSPDCNLIVFADFNSKNPYIVEISNGQSRTVKKYNNDFYATSPDSMLSVFQWIVDNYPAYEYSLVMEGHGSGPIVRKDSIQTNLTKLYAYGSDAAGEVSATSKESWLNIPSFAAVLSHIPHLEYIFFDCCSMQTVEVAYELRKYADYIIAPASETPGPGAPYNTVVPVLSADKDLVGKEIIDRYIEDTNWGYTGGISISSIKTSELEPLMYATRTALHNLYKEKGVGEKLHLNNSHSIYYYRHSESAKIPVLHDIKNIMLNSLSADAYNTWLPYLERAVSYKYMPVCKSGNTYWKTYLGINFNDFTVEDSNYSGLSMIVPNDNYDMSELQTIPYPSINKTMFKLEWFNAIGWQSLGWPKPSQQ